MATLGYPERNAATPFSAEQTNTRKPRRCPRDGQLVGDRENLCPQCKRDVAIIASTSRAGAKW
jgi:hypothetical protein